MPSHVRDHKLFSFNELGDQMTTYKNEKKKKKNRLAERKKKITQKNARTSNKNRNNKPLRTIEGPEVV